MSTRLSTRLSCGFAPNWLLSTNPRFPTIVMVRPSVRGMIRWSPDLQDQSLAPDPVPPVSDPMYSHQRV